MQLVVSEPSVVAIEKDGRGPGKVKAVGKAAKEMLGRTPANIVATRPMKDGVIADFEVTAAMIEYFIKRVHDRTRMVRPRVVVAVPSGITEVEKRAVRESAMMAGAREVYLIKEPMAAAIGIGLPVADPVGSMVIDIGGGTTEIAVIALSGIVTWKSIKMAGDELNDSIIQFLKRKYSLLVGERSAEEIKCAIGAAGALEQEIQHTCRGLDLVSSIPKTIIVDSSEIREALSEPVNAIIEAVRQNLEQTPPELAADILDRGIILTGGGALLRGLDKLLVEETSLPVIVAEALDVRRARDWQGPRRYFSLPESSDLVRVSPCKDSTSSLARIAPSLRLVLPL